MSCFKRIVCQCVMVNPPLFFAFTSRSALWSVSERKDSPAFIVSSCLSISMKHETTFSLIYMRPIYTWRYVFQPFTPLHQSHNFIQKFPIPSERWIGWRVREHVSMYIRIRARVIILRYALNPFSLHLKNISFRPLWESAFCKKSLKNLAWKFGGYVLKH